MNMYICMYAFSYRNGEGGEGRRCSCSGRGVTSHRWNEAKAGFEPWLKVWGPNH